MRNKILIFEEPGVAKKLQDLVSQWGYMPICVSPLELMIYPVAEIIQGNSEVAVIILAKEMPVRTNNRSLCAKSISDSTVEIDFEFGLNIYGKIREKGIPFPVILTTTDDLTKDDLLCYRNPKGMVKLMVLEKPFLSEDAVRLVLEECVASNQEFL